MRRTLPLLVLTLGCPEADEPVAPEPVQAEAGEAGELGEAPPSEATPSQPDEATYEAHADRWLVIVHTAPQGEPLPALELPSELTPHVLRLSLIHI